MKHCMEIKYSGTLTIRRGFTKQDMGDILLQNQKKNPKSCVLVLFLVNVPCPTRISYGLIRIKNDDPENYKRRFYIDFQKVNTYINV